MWTLLYFDQLGIEQQPIVINGPQGLSRKGPKVVDDPFFVNKKMVNLNGNYSACWCIFSVMESLWMALDLQVYILLSGLNSFPSAGSELGSVPGHNELNTKLLSQLVPMVIIILVYG